MSEKRFAQKDIGGTTGREHTKVRKAVAYAQQRTIDEAARMFAEALMLSYERVLGNEDSAHRIREDLILRFFDKVDSHLRARTRADSSATQEQVAAIRESTRARRALTEESAQSYVDFLRSMADYSQSLKENETRR